MTRAREISNVLGRNIESTTFTATAGQTAFSITHAAGRIQVYMNGLLLDPTVDWTSDGSTVTLTEGAVAGDELEVVKFDNLAVADAIPRTGHTGTIDFSDATFTPPAGHVVQVKTTNTILMTSTTSTTYADLLKITGFTPKFATSKLKIDVCFRWQESVIVNTIKYKVLHDSTRIYEIGNYASYEGGASNTITSNAFHIFTDADDTTSRDIQFQVAVFSSSGNCNFNPNGTGTESTLTVTEIAQ